MSRIADGARQISTHARRGSTVLGARVASRAASMAAEAVRSRIDRQTVALALEMRGDDPSWCRAWTTLATLAGLVLASQREEVGVKDPSLPLRCRSSSHT